MIGYPSVLRAIVFALWIASVVVFAPHAFAQQHAPRLRASVSSTQVEVGEVFSVQVSAMASAGDDTPQRPHLPVPAGIVVRGGPSISTQTEVSITGGSMVQRVGTVSTWQVEARRPGRFRIGPPSVMWSGKRLEANPVEVNVLPAGSQGQRGARRGKNPFDPFGMLGIPRMPNLLGDDPDDQPAEIGPPTDPTLSLDVAPDRNVFLRAVVDKTEAFVGEQIKLTVYQYVRNGMLELTDVHEPSAADFLQLPLLDPNEHMESRLANVGGSIWRVHTLRKLALFPLKAGRLDIGPMRLSFVGFGVRGQASRESPPLVITVRDTPSARRPVGFKPGDVGDFAISATVDPRSVERDGATSVRITVKGKGNLPTTLTVPNKKGVEWLEPQVTQKVEIDGDRIAGTRTFAYVVKLHEPGNVDLGEVTLPFFDPDRREYRTAKASLGQIMVANTGPSRVVTETPQQDPFSVLAPVRRQLQPSPARPSYWTDSKAYWIALASLPLSVLLASAGISAGRKISGRLRTRRDSTERRAHRALDQAASHLKERDYKSCAASVERAIHASIEGATGIKSRGLLRAELAERLKETLHHDEMTSRILQVLNAADTLRFEPQLDASKADRLVEETSAILDGLSRGGRKDAK